MAGTSDEVKWEAKLREEMKGITAEKVWPFFEDFCNLYKVFPFVDKSWRLEGEEGNPGLIRYCVASVPAFEPSSAASTPPELFWAKEKLLMIDPLQRCLSYQLLENNLGIKAYVATIKVVPATRGDAEDDGCCIEWTVVADPMEGMTFQEFESDWISHLHSMVQRIQTLLL